MTERQRTPPSKWEVYESILRVPYYVLFDKPTSAFRIFELTGTAYRELFQERLWIEALEIGLGVWQGRFDQEDRPWLRWYDSAGNWIPIAEEREEQERQGRLEAEQREEQERQRAELAEQRAALLAERLRALGMDPEDLRSS